MKWDIDEVNGDLWVVAEVTKSLTGSMKEKTGIRFTKNLTYCYNHHCKWCTLESENEKIGNFLVKRFKNKKFALKFIKDYKEFDEKSIKRLNRLDKINFSRIRDNRLFEVLKKANNIHINNFDWGFIIEPMDFVMPGMIQSRLKKHGFSNQEISDMIAIADTTFLNKEKQGLIKILKKPKGNHASSLKKHAYNYRWIHTTYLGRKNIPFSYFKNRLERLKKRNLNKELNDLKRFKINVEKRKKEIVKKKPISKETKILLEIADIIAPLHDRRKELLLRSIYTIDTVKNEITKRYGYTKDELSVFQIEDLLKLKEGKKLDKKYAKALAKEALLYIDIKRNIWKYYSGKRAREIIKKELAFDLVKTNEIWGMNASSGKAKGTVKIIQGIKDMPKMRKGDIIVASMTKPEFVPVLKKAAAIITNEGGVTCHAAIISRELGIPCIIGTKIATKVLKDGDFVEVDTDKGVVNIVKKHKEDK